MRSLDLNKRLADRPFKAFRMHLSDGKILDVHDPGMVMVGRSSAHVPTKFGRDEGGFPILLDWQTVALSRIVRFTELRARRNGARRRKV